MAELHYWRPKRFIINDNSKGQETSCSKFLTVVIPKLSVK